jgi:predicted nucleotidyltransferase
MTDLDEVRRIVLEGLRGHSARVYLFGSWARGCASRISDIDVAVEPAQPLPRGLLAEIHGALDESRILYPVDLVDLSEAAPALRVRVESEGVLWSA